jgi:hypothetical protein
MIDLTLILSDPQLTDEQLQERTQTLRNALIESKLGNDTEFNPD